MGSLSQSRKGKQINKLEKVLAAVCSGGAHSRDDSFWRAGCTVSGANSGVIGFTSPLSWMGDLIMPTCVVNSTAKTMCLLSASEQRMRVNATRELGPRCAPRRFLMKGGDEEDGLGSCLFSPACSLSLCYLKWRGRGGSWGIHRWSYCFFQNSFIALKIPCTPPIHPYPNP